MFLKNLRPIVLMAIILPSQTWAAVVDTKYQPIPESTDIQVRQAFEDYDGNTVLELKGGPDEVDDQVFFYGNRREKQLYQLRTQAKRVSEFKNYDIEFDAPTTNEPQRKGKIVVSEGVAKVICSTGTKCFKRMSPDWSRNLQIDLQLHAVKLLQLPTVRLPIYLFKLKTENRYVYVDALSSASFIGMDGLTVFVGEPGKLKKVSVLSSRGFIEKATNTRTGEVFRDLTSLGMTFKDGSQLDLPFAYSSDKAPTLTFGTDGEVVQLEEIKNPSLTLLKEIGVDLERLPTVPLVTPCDRILL